mmetsp:Transcript_8079/g.19181  ORF Transcript_8079/g.19181 Transcript_8079/m.19181 type:complete len:232 (-) Transcript_8079:511-1206(-)
MLTAAGRNNLRSAGQDWRDTGRWDRAQAGMRGETPWDLGRRLALGGVQAKHSPIPAGAPGCSDANRRWSSPSDSSSSRPHPRASRRPPPRSASRTRSPREPVVGGRWRHVLPRTTSPCWCTRAGRGRLARRHGLCLSRGGSPFCGRMTRGRGLSVLGAGSEEGWEPSSAGRRGRRRRRSRRRPSWMRRMSVKLVLWNASRSERLLLIRRTSTQAFPAWRAMTSHQPPSPPP